MQMQAVIKISGGEPLCKFWPAAVSCAPHRAHL